MSRPDAQTRRNRTKLLLIFALFLLPPVSAWVAWKYFSNAGVDTTTNAGTLIVPARPLALEGLRDTEGNAVGDDALRGRWTYVVFANGGCDEVCEKQLYLTRQVRLAVNKDIPRVQRLLLLDAAPPAALAQQLADAHADLLTAVRGAAAEALMTRFRGEGFSPAGTQYFLIDPLGNLMMFYDLDVPTKGMMRDLQKLLKISQIG